MDWIILVVLAAGLGLIPANIAKQKGYDFTKWWIYGWLLFIVAMIHVCIIPDKNMQLIQQKGGLSAADELKKYKELLDSNVITEKEYEKKKEQLLKML